MKLLILTVFFLPIMASSAEKTFMLSEGSLQKLIKKDGPNQAELESKLLAIELEKAKFDELFGAKAYAHYGHTKTNEKSIIPFQPVFKSIHQYQVGIQKKTMYGIDIDINQSVDNRSGDTATGSEYDAIHTTTYEVGLNFDLWKDFIGLNSRRNYENLKELEHKEKIEKKIADNLFWLNTRKIYWAIFSNAEKIKITNRLLQTSIKQAAEVKKRKANSISDKAEVAIFESKVSQRKGQLYYLEYERELLYKNLRSLFPELKDKEIKLAKVNELVLGSEVLACTGKIFKEGATPLGSSQYIEMIDSLKSIKSRQEKIDSNHNDISLKFQLKYQQKGISSNSEDSVNYEGSYEDSLDDISDNSRQAIVGGLHLVIPLGKKTKTRKEIQEKLNSKRYYAQIKTVENKIYATHKQVQESVKILSRVIETQKINSQHLLIRVKEMNRKYRQARIPEYVLFEDQESLLQSDVQIIDTKLKIIDTLLEYYSVFQNYNCSFNRKL